MTPVVLGNDPTASGVASEIVVQVVIESATVVSNGVVRQFSLQLTEISLR